MHFNYSPLDASKLTEITVPYETYDKGLWSG